MAHIWVLYGSWVWSTESPWPPWASVVKAVFWTSDLHQGLRERLRKPRVTPNIEKADGGHMSLKLGDTIIGVELSYSFCGQAALFPALLVHFHLFAS